MNLKISFFAVFFIWGSIFPPCASSQLLAKNEGSGRILYGVASYYGKGFHGKKTANGEIFDQHAMTAACNVLPLGTWIRVTNLKNDRQVIVKVNDRLHFRMRRIADMSQGAAEKLGFIQSGLTRVKIEVLPAYKP